MGAEYARLPLRGRPARPRAENQSCHVGFAAETAYVMENLRDR